jgi:ABC-type glutathione transport system ATPase component
MRSSPDTIRPLVQATLSGGQRQIVVDAISIFKAPVVMLDEPTSALDPASRNDVMNLIEDEIQRSMIIITHDPAVMKDGHRPRWKVEGICEGK